MSKKNFLASRALLIALGLAAAVAPIYWSAPLTSCNPRRSSRTVDLAVEKNTRPGKLPLGNTAAVQGGLEEAYGRLPISFEPNEGQADRRVKFLSRGSGYTLFLTGDEAVLALRERIHTRIPNAEAPSARVLRMKLAGQNPSPQITGLDELPGTTNYFIGSDPKQWRTKVPTYAKVRYQNVYPGIDLLFRGNQRRLEFDFVVAKGADRKANNIAIFVVKRPGLERAED